MGGCGLADFTFRLPSLQHLTFDRGPPYLTLAPLQIAPIFRLLLKISVEGSILRVWLISFDAPGIRWADTCSIHVAFSLSLNIRTFDVTWRTDADGCVKGSRRTFLTDLRLSMRRSDSRGLSYLVHWSFKFKTTDHFGLIGVMLPPSRRDIRAKATAMLLGLVCRLVHASHKNKKKSRSISGSYIF